MTKVQSSNHFFLFFVVIGCLFLIFGFIPEVEAKGAGSIYHEGWIDLNKNGRMDGYENPKLSIEVRIDDLLARMTLEEKTCQMVTLYGYGHVLKDQQPTENWPHEYWKDGIANIDEHLHGRYGSQYAWPPSKHVKALETVQRFFIEDTRLGIPVDFSCEGIRGVAYQGATCFPAQIGIGSTWDVELVNQVGHITGKEARLAGFSNVYSPILDLARDARWGRTVECYTEDPFLGSRLGVAMVKGLQAEGVVSTAKHFAVYSMPKGGRDGSCRTDPHVSRRDAEMILMAPFRAAFVEGRALGTMSSYNDYDGIPITASKYFLTEKLRQEWGFKGYVVSDSMAVKYIHSKHKVAENYTEAVRQAVEAGLNVRTAFDGPEVYADPIRQMVRQGVISMATIDARVRDVLRVKYMLGLFDRPYSDNPQEGNEVIRCQEHQEVTLQAARESIVLLKNENDVLPLSKKIKSILVTGPNAKDISFAFSRYGPNNGKAGYEIDSFAGHEIKVISVLEGIRNKLGGQVEIKYTKGCELIDGNWPESEIFPQEPTAKEAAEIEKARVMAQNVDAAIVVLGESNDVVGESRSRTSLDLPGHQRALVKAVYETGTPTIVVLINGRPLTINWVDKYVPAIVEAWFCGEKGGTAIADVLFGDYNPGGKLPVTFVKTVGQIPMNFPYKPASHADGTNNTRINGLLYPFGYGLSYTKFKYSNLKISPTQQGVLGETAISFEVENIGARKGDEVVQLYVNDVTSSVITFVKELRGFKRITLAPGAKKQVRFRLKPEDLSLLDRNMKRVVEPGLFEVMVGSSSEDIRLRGSFQLGSGMP